MSTDLGTHPVEDPDQLAIFADEDLERGLLALEFLYACRCDADAHEGWVDPNRVRARLLASLGPDINKRQLSALWSTATARDGYLDNTDERVQITGEGSRGNGNKSVRLRRWRDWS